MKMIQSHIFWLVIVLLLIGAGVVVRVAIQKKSEEPRARNDEADMCMPGFMDDVKHPEEWKEQLDSADRALEKAMAEAKSWNDRRIEAEVWRFVFEIKNSRDAWVEGRVLRSLGAKVTPVLMKYLSDGTLRARLVKPTEEGTLPETPFNRLCDLLAENPPADAVKPLAPFLDDESSQIRKQAALVLGIIGSKSSIPLLRKALNDADEYVRSYSLIGIERSIKNKRMDPSLPGALFDDLRRLVSSGLNSRNAAQLLINFDRENAVQFLLSEDQLSLESKSLHDSLQALNENAILVPRDTLLDLIAKLEKKELKYPVTYQLGESLAAIGRHRDPADRGLLERFIAKNEETVAECAAKGMIASHGLEGFDKRIWDTIERRGIDALTAPQRHYNAVLAFDGEVRNGGHSQYFFNSSGDDWKHAAAGLDAMECKERFAILTESLSKFGPSGPSENRDRRMSQLAKIARAKDDPFNELDTRYYKSKELLEVLAVRYVLKNPEAFR